MSSAARGGKRIGGGSYKEVTPSIARSHQFVGLLRGGFSVTGSCMSSGTGNPTFRDGHHSSGLVPLRRQ